MKGNLDSPRKGKTKKKGPQTRQTKRPGWAKPAPRNIRRRPQKRGNLPATEATAPRIPIPEPLTTAAKPQRINQILSLAGLTSRRKADEWIAAGRVRIHGKKVTEPGAKAVWGVDRIHVDGREIPGPTTRLHLMLNKPFGYICSLSDPQGRPLVTSLLKEVPQRLYSVGRLDFDSMGLLLLTNDGEWANRLMHPRYRIPRTYKATVEGAIGEEEIAQLRRGVMLSDGPTLPARVAVIKKIGGRSLIRITIRQGRTRQVRRMLEAVGHPVSHLIRIGFGSLALGDLKVGEYRTLEPEELEALKRTVRMR